jgi:glutathione S-transferase
VYTPFFMRFWFLEYYEGFDLPDEARYARVRRWRDAALAHPAAQQVTQEQIVKLYYDYAKGAGNGALLPGRTRSSFVFEPDWRTRPWPPRDKYGPGASDAELGL